MGLKLPQPLKIEGNLSTNWRTFKRALQNYSVVARLDSFQENFKAALFLSVIAKEALEMFDGIAFSNEADKQVLSKVIKKFEEFSQGETNETYKRFIFNQRNQEENESIDKYVTVIRKVAQICNFCNCLNDSLLRNQDSRIKTTFSEILRPRKISVPAMQRE